MAHEKILVCDDEERIRKLVKDFLLREGYTVVEAADGEEALNVFDTNPDLSLMILDVMMPKTDGFTVLKEVRKRSDIPVIMLTAKGDEDDELNGFMLGSDEYMKKPFSPKILVARVGAVIRRAADRKKSDDKDVLIYPATDDVLEENGIKVDIDRHSVYVDGKEVNLSVKEFDLLVYFMKNKGMALSRDMILNNVWNYDYFGDTRTVDTHVKKLRAKLPGKGDMIKTIWGMGYKFET